VTKTTVNEKLDWNHEKMPWPTMTTREFVEHSAGKVENKAITVTGRGGL
jgi:hypothetical protein